MKIKAGIHYENDVKTAFCDAWVKNLHDIMNNQINHIEQKRGEAS